MKLSEIPLFRQALLDWFRRQQRDLPWRRYRDPYRIWIAEVMLQQTQVATVKRYYQNFLETFPTLERLAEASEQAVLKAWEGLGYYARARHLRQAARQVMEEYKGAIPRDYPSFRALPGVGEYIAAAVLSMAYDQPHAAVDGNVRRVLARILRLEEPPEENSARREIRNWAIRLLDPARPGEFNQAMMELGALVCTPGPPGCSECPVRNHCLAYRQGDPERFPRRKPKRSLPLRRVAVGVVLRDGKLLITRRRSEGLLGGLWEFPGGKIRPGEKAGEACRREIREEVGLQVEPFKNLATIKHGYSHFRVELQVFVCYYRGGSVQLNGPVDYRWIFPGEIKNFPFPGANHKFLPRLRDFLRQLESAGNRKE